MSNLSVGHLAPDFKLPDQFNKIHSLSDYRGRKVLLYFYPQDDTPGCAEEACSLRDTFPNLSEVGLEIIGVSPDSVSSHSNFAVKYNLPFTLLSDSNLSVIKQYGVWRENAVARASFLIDQDGRILKTYNSVTPKTHALEVLEDISKTKIN